MASLGAVTPPFQAYIGDDPYLFVCYAHADKAEVYTELIRLRDEGENLWYDEGIPPGSMWTQEIASAINGCKLFLFFVTPESVQSINCVNELQFAVSRGKRILAIHLQPTDLPESLELSMGSLQALHKYALREEDYTRKVRDAVDPSHSISTRTSPGSRRPSKRATSWIAVILLALVAYIAWLGRSPAYAGWSVAVAPFTQMSDIDGNSWVASSITTEIRAGLGRIPQIKLAGRSGSPGYAADRQQVAHVYEADVDKVVEGTVRQSGQWIRVTVQLVSVGDGYQIWSDVYDQELTENFAAEIEIAKRVVDAIAQIAGTEGTPQLTISEFPSATDDMTDAQNTIEPNGNFTQEIDDDK